MEQKLFSKDCITLDGRMDEPVWENVEEHTGFRMLGSAGGAVTPYQTAFKILPCEDRIYVGIKCTEPDGMDQLLATRYRGNGAYSPSVEMFFSPSGSDYEFYQFLATINGQKSCHYYAEGGNIKPDKFAPDWNFAVYIGENDWSFEVEIPLTAFYWTPHTRWSDKWLVNITRNHTLGPTYTTWCPTQFGFLEPEKFRTLTGFPIRPTGNDICIASAEVELTEQCGDLYKGIMTVKTTNAVADTFDFVSDHGETVTVSLQAGSNEFTAPCFFDKLGRNRTMLSLVRKSDGEVFKRYYPVMAVHEPIKLHLTLPEYRCNFYPGQDYKKVVGTAISTKPVTLKLEGPGIETTVISPEADGSFIFETPGFEEGEAFLTATIDGYEVKKKIRRLAPTGRMMTWISGGNLIVNGKPVLRRDLYGRHYMGGEAFNRRYDADNLHETYLCSQKGELEPRNLMPKSEKPGGEATKDGVPSEEMLRLVDQMLEANKDNDFAYYYISDEPECRGLSPVYFKHLYNYVAERDPYHVILTASRRADANIDIADWFETHPYICPYNHKDGRRVLLRPLHTLGKHVDDIVKLNRPDKCIGFLSTCYASSSSSGGWDYPTFDEYIAHTWAAMMRGGKTLWPYAYHDVNDRASLYEGNRYLFSSFEALEDIVLFGKRTTLYKTIEAESVLYEHGEEKMFVLVNLTQEPQTVTLEALTGTWHGFRVGHMITEKTFRLKPMETVIGTSHVRDTGLPTYDETVAVIEKAEYQRTHIGSLLFERGDDIEMYRSPARGWGKPKLFDGVRDNVSYTLTPCDEQFMALDLSKVKPTFTKIILHGYRIDDAKVKLWNGDEWQDPEIVESHTEEFSKTFLLKEAVTADGLRFDFSGKNRVEFYEIEVFA